MSARVGDDGPVTWPTASAVQQLVGGLFNAGQARTFQKVRRNSPHAGEREQRLWRQFNTFSRDDNNAIMAAAEQMERESKKPGKRNGCLGHIGLTVLRLLIRLRDKVTGRLEPKVEWIAAKIGHSRSATHAALVRLKLSGFLDWMRRSIPVEDPEPGGQYVQQTSNAYVIALSENVQKLVARIKRRLTPKQASDAAEADRQARSRAMTAEQNIAAIDHQGLKNTLARINDVLEGENSPGGHINRPCS